MKRAVAETACACPRSVVIDAPVHSVLGLPFHAITEEQAAEAVCVAVRERRRLVLTTPNLNFAVACRKDAAFRDSVLRSDLVVADGMPLVWLARLLRIPIPERVAGSSLFERLRRSGPATRQRPLRVFFFGGPPGAAVAACRALDEEQGRMVGAGWCDPGFGDLEALSSAEIVEAINASAADFLIIALGAVKGQAWIMRNAALLNVPVISHLGAVVNFTAGTLRRAPRWVQACGLEWLWRIKEEPQLWRRYAGDAGALAGMLLREVFQCWWYNVGPARRFVRARKSGLTRHRDELECRLDLSGDWCGVERGLLRQLIDFVDEPLPLVMDVSAIERVDSATVGTLSRLVGLRRGAGLATTVWSGQGRARALLLAYGARVLLE